MAFFRVELLLFIRVPGPFKNVYPMYLDVLRCINFLDTFYADGLQLADGFQSFLSFLKLE